MSRKRTLLCVSSHPLTLSPSHLLSFSHTECVSHGRVVTQPSRSTAQSNSEAADNFLYQIWTRETLKDRGGCRMKAELCFWDYQDCAIVHPPREQRRRQSVRSGGKQSPSCLHVLIFQASQTNGGGGVDPKRHLCTFTANKYIEILLFQLGRTWQEAKE